MSQSQCGSVSGRSLSGSEPSFSGQKGGGANQLNRGSRQTTRNVSPDPAAPSECAEGGQRWPETAQGSQWQVVESKKSKALPRALKACQSAINSLYSSCEWECNLQVTERAVLLLQGAVSDFIELAGRLQQLTAAHSATSHENNTGAIAWQVKTHHRASNDSIDWDPPDSEFSSSMARTASHTSITVTATTDLRAASITAAGKLAAAEPSAKSSRTNSTSSRNANDWVPISTAGSRRVAGASRESSTKSSPADSNQAGLTIRVGPSPGAAPNPAQPWKEKVNWAQFFTNDDGDDAHAARLLHEKLMSPERMRKSPAMTQKRAVEKQARAEQLRIAALEERRAKLERTRREREAARMAKEERDTVMLQQLQGKQARSAELRQAHLAAVVHRAGDETRKVHEVAFINTLMEHDRKLQLQQRLEEGEARRHERLAAILAKQAEAQAAVEEVQERKKAQEAERQQLLQEKQRRKLQQAQAKVEEERRAAAMAREAAKEQQRAREEQLAAAREEQVAALTRAIELRLHVAAQRRLQHLELIRERAVLKSLDASDRQGSLPPSPTSPHRSSPGAIFAAEPMPSSPLKSADRSITLASNAKSRLKGLRRRAAKLLRQMADSRQDYVEAEEDCAVLHSQEARALCHCWQELVMEVQDAKAGAPRHQVLERLVVNTTTAIRMHVIAAAHAARPSGLFACLCGALSEPRGGSSALPQQLRQQLAELLVQLLECPANCSYLLASGLLPPVVKATAGALDACNSAACEEDVGWHEEGACVAAMLQVLQYVVCHKPDTYELLRMRELLVSYILAQGIINRIREVFSLFDQPQVATAPIPHYVVQSLLLLEALTWCDGNRTFDAGRNWTPPASNGQAMVLTFKETAMVGLPSLLTAVLLHAAPSCTPAEAQPEALPSNFVGTARSVMRVLSNTARVDLATTQDMLGSGQLHVEFFHLTSFLLSYCTNQWTGCDSPVAELLNEVLLLIGYFAVLNKRNQDILQWGKAPCILQRLCSVPPPYFQDPGLLSVLMPTLLCTCFHSDRTCETICQFVSLDYLIGYVERELSQLPASFSRAQHDGLEQPRPLRPHIAGRVRLFQSETDDPAQPRETFKGARRSLDGHDHRRDLQADLSVTVTDRCCGADMEPAGPAERPTASNPDGLHSAVSGQATATSPMFIQASQANGAMDMSPVFLAAWQMDPCSSVPATRADNTHPGHEGIITGNEPQAYAPSSRSMQQGGSSSMQVKLSTLALEVGTSPTASSRSSPQREAQPGAHSRRMDARSNGVNHAAVSASLTAQPAYANLEPVGCEGSISSNASYPDSPPSGRSRRASSESGTTGGVQGLLGGALANTEQPGAPSLPAPDLTPYLGVGMQRQLDSRFRLAERFPLALLPEALAYLRRLHCAGRVKRHSWDSSRSSSTV